MKEEDWLQKDIVVALRVSEGAVSQWLKRGREGGMKALETHPPQGMTPRLSAEQKEQIPELLAKGAEAYGYRGDVWTASRVAEVIAKTFGVRYHRDHVGRLLREAGWSRQKPVERASQRNEEALKNWSDERWPDIKKKAGEEKATIVWADSTPAGETDAGSPDSAICGITLDGRLFMQVRLASYNAEAVVGFLRVHLRKMRGQDRSHLGWLAHPPGSRDQRLSQAWGCLTLISGATARLRARSQS